MGKTTLGLLITIFITFALCWGAGLLTSIPIDWLQAIIQGDFESITMEYGIFQIIYNMIMLAGTAGIVVGLIFPNVVDMLIVKGFVVVLLGIVLSFVDVAFKIAELNAFFAVIFVLVFIVIGFIIIVDWWRNPTN